MKRYLAVTCMALMFALAGCGRGSKQDIAKKAEGIKAKADLEKALGKPDSFNKALMGETWTYKASDGEVTFTIMGDQVTPLTFTSDAEKKK